MHAHTNKYICNADYRKKAASMTSLTWTPSTTSTRSVSPTCSERRLSVRQTESVFKYKHILVKKTLNFTQVLLSATVGNQKNVLTVRVR